MRDMLRLFGFPSPTPARAGEAYEWPIFIGTSARYALEWGLGLSLVVHAVLLVVHFSTPDPDHFTHKDKGLEVVLVNSRHAQKPDKAKLAAQSNLDGGGQTDEDVRATTPLPPQEQTQNGDSLMEAKRRVQEAEAAQTQLVNTLKASPNRTQVDPRHTPPSEAVKPNPGLDQMDLAAAVAQTEAEISKKLQEYAQRPRKQFIGSKAVENRFALYVEHWRQYVEKVGTLNYPAAAKGKVYGSLIVSTTIKSDGSIVKVEVVQSSGHKILDAAAMRIIQQASPLPPFPAEIRRDTDMIEIVRTLSFTKADEAKIKD